MVPRKHRVEHQANVSQDIVHIARVHKGGRKYDALSPDNLIVPTRESINGVVHKIRRDISGSGSGGGRDEYFGHAFDNPILLIILRLPVRLSYDVNTIIRRSPLATLPLLLRTRKTVLVCLTVSTL